MGKITRKATQNHDEWVSQRSHYIGGSDAAAVVGMNDYTSPYCLWAEKTGKVPGFAGNLATEVGAYLEDFVAKKFAEETGKKVRNEQQSYFNSDYPWAIANIDRAIVGEDAGQEIKTTNEMNLKKFKGGEYPSNYYCQMVHYMAVTGKKRWYLAVLIGNHDFRIFTLDRDEAEIKALMDAEKEFWGYVESKEPPPIDGMKSTTETIAEIYTGTMDADADLRQNSTAIEQYLAACKQIKELEKVRDEAANKIKNTMASAERGETDKYYVTWKQSSRKSFNVREFMRDNPDIDQSDYYNTSTYRTFKVAERKGEI